MNFENKHVIVTGGAKGIGGATSEAFHAQGAKVSIFDIDQEGKKLEEKLANHARHYACDLADGKEIQKSIVEAVNHFGNVDILVNNVGIIEYGTVTQTSEEVWDRTMNINLKAAFLCSKYALPSMQEQESGVVVNVSSVQAFITQGNVAAYTTSKTAMLGLTRSIAVDYAPKIRSVAVCPGSVDTPMFQWGINQSPDPQEVLEECNEMHLTKRIGKPEEVAQLILFLCSDNASFCTGQAYRVDGGLGVSIGGSKRD